MLARFFGFKRYGTSLGREVLAGATTFVTMAYIIIIAPAMLHQAGMPHGSAFVGVCIIIAFASILTGLLSNLPFALAPGLGLLSYFSYVVTQQLGYSWQAALGAVLISGILFVLITITRIRRFILEAIPHSLGCAIAAGIGFFIGFIALRNVGVIIADPHTLVTLGAINTPTIGLFFLGFFIIAVLDARRIPGSILIGMAVVTVLGMLFGIAHLQGVVSLPPYPSALGQLQVNTWFHWRAFPVIFTFFIVALFDSTGTILGLNHYLDKPANDPQQLSKINRALVAESISTVGAALVGSSTVCPFIENAAGIRAGGRTGFTAIVTALFFLCMLFFSPLAASIPSFATSAALFYVACLMIKPFSQVNWEELTEYVPAIITMFTIPLTFSIADGIGLGLVCYVVLRISRGQWRQIHPILWVLALVFVSYFLV